jgi:hypothetical protein
MHHHHHQEGVNLLRERHALGADHARQLLELMRVEGVRRVNVHKNTTKALYAFNGAVPFWLACSVLCVVCVFGFLLPISSISPFNVPSYLYFFSCARSSATLNAPQRVPVPRLRVRQGGVLRRSTATLHFSFFLSFQNGRLSCLGATLVYISDLIHIQRAGIIKILF